jgi:hypothetical protein
MPQKIRIPTRVNRVSTVEQIARERIPRVNSLNMYENVGVTPEEEVSINQIFRKIAEILQTMTERHRPRDEVEALECFLKFQPPIFVGEAEQDHKAKVWLECIEDIFMTLQYSEEYRIKFATFRLQGPTRDWWIRVQEAWEQSGVEWTWNTLVLVFRAEFIPQ